ncbi:MAG: transglutaminase-like domain-containing protein [Pseudonocardia sp.]
MHTFALEAWEAGKGVCQDYVHLTLLLLREAGIPARYVSGHLLPNLIDIGQRHVWVASGRDYHDVPPLKGVYSGGTASALDVTVDMTRLA